MIELQNDDASPITRRLMFPLATAITLLVACLVVAVLLLGHHWETQSGQQTAEHHVQDFRDRITERTLAISAVADILADRPEIAEGIARDDRAGLLRALSGQFNRLRSSYGISHLYVHRANRTNLLRVHHPESHGDLIERKTLRDAANTLNIASGIETGPYGPLTLRVVKPLVIDGVLRGFIELGLEIRDLLSTLHQDTGTDLVMTVKKSALNRQAWENAMRVYHYTTDWDSLADSVLIYASRPALAAIVPQLASAADTTPGDMVLDERPRTVRRHAVPYGDGLQTGSLYFIVDRSESRATIHRLLGISLSIAALLFVALVVHVARLLSRTDRQMVASQAALREHKARLAAILDHAPLGIWMSDLDGRCHYLNRRMAVTAGVPDGAPPDPQLAALSGTPGITDCGECPHRDCLRDQAPCRARGVTTDADGQQHELEIVKAPLRNADGGIAGIIGIAIDITEQRRAERAQRLYAQLFEHCGEAILVTDDKVRIVDVNPAFTRLTGYLKAEVLGNNPRMLSSGRTAPEVYGDLWRRLLADGFWQGELWDRRKDGSTYPKWTNIFAIRNDDGAITHYAATFSDISEQKSAQTRIEYLAHHDPLTGLFNRLSLTQRLDQAVLTARRDRLEVALLFVDLDRFKSINDTRGHGVGDHLLIEVAKRLNLCVRESDIVARLGGDEFVVALTHLSCADDARPVVEKIHLSLSAGYVIDGQPLDTSPSIGVARFPSDGETPESLLKSADEAMYRAKSAGRNRVAYFSKPPGGV